MVKRWVKHYPQVSEKKAREVISDVVHEWFEQALIETVIGALGLRGAKFWSPDVKRALGSKLGSLTKATA